MGKFKLTTDILYVKIKWKGKITFKLIFNSTYWTDERNAKNKTT